jgi:hypothetical protein
MAFPRPKEKSFTVVVVLLCSAGLIFAGLNIWSIFRNRESYFNEALIKSSAQAQLLAENSAGVIYGVDLMLLSIRSILLHEQGQDPLRTLPVAQMIEEELRFLPQISEVVLVDSTGGAIYSSAGSKRFELAAFAEHRDAWVDFSVDAVIEAKDEAKIILSRPLENRKNEFIGALAATVRPAFFYTRFNDYLNIDVDAVALVDMKGRVLTGWVRDSDPENKFVGAAVQGLPHFSSVGEAAFSGGGRRSHESEAAIVSTHQLPGFPFHVAVSYSKKNVLQKWRRETTRHMVILFFTTLIVALALALAHRHRQRRRNAELDLRVHLARLEETVAERTVQLTETNRELLQKNAELEEAISEVKTLSGLLPICSYCKKIRDDKGYWTQIESYVRRHSEADFSHSICPDCARKHFPEYDIYDED